jgi:DNA-binding HxlR family transcriptional regulator
MDHDGSDPSNTDRHIQYLTSSLELASIYEICCPSQKERKMERSEYLLSLGKATALLGRPWTLLILDALGGSPCRFTELIGRLPGISTNLLTERLRQLQAFGVIERDTGSIPQFVITYRLSKLGAQLEPIIGEIAAWGSRLPLHRIATSSSRSSAAASGCRLCWRRSTGGTGRPHCPRVLLRRRGAADRGRSGHADVVALSVALRAAAE